ncbi:hypothetical protein BGZ60DRAFT_526173 [Tricladium varicosporioides]|nr:hypothetical protein BGZ60DRAFT_526173 [Hymenoscyphus varicosporioides]
MKFSLLTVFGLAGLVYSQSNLAGLPDCAKTCVTQYTTGSSIGGCPALDIVCICSSSGFLSGIACCLAGSCNAADQATAVTFARNFCGSSGVTNLPSSVSCSSTSAASSTGTAVSSASTASAASASSVSSTATSKSGAQITSSPGYKAAGIVGGLAAGLAFL